LTVPPKQGVRRRNRGDLPQDRTADSVRSGSQPTAILVRETQPTPTNLMPQKPVLLDQIRDGLPFLAIQPAGQHTEYDLQRNGIDHWPELTSSSGVNDIGRDVEHYGVAWRRLREGRRCGE
jgi:hypothetical protein